MGSFMTYRNTRIRQQSCRYSIALIMVFLVLFAGDRGGAYASSAGKKHLARWQEFEQSTQRYRERIDYLKEMSEHIVAEADGQIKKAVREKNYEWAQSLAMAAMEKLTTIIEEVTQLVYPPELVQFYRKRIELHSYQRMFYEAFLRGNPELEISNRRMCLQAQAESLEELRRLYVAFSTPPAFFASLDVSIATLQQEITFFDNPHVLQRRNLPLASIEAEY